jgi:hypothetical protein
MAVVAWTNEWLLQAIHKLVDKALRLVGPLSFANKQVVARANLINSAVFESVNQPTRDCKKGRSSELGEGSYRW